MDWVSTVSAPQVGVAAAEVTLPDAALMLLDERAEGWAGLRLVALSLAANLRPARFAEEFSRARLGGPTSHSSGD